MKNRKALKAASLLVRILIWLNLFLGFALLISVGIWHFSPERFQHIELLRGFKAGYGIGDFKLHMSEPDNRLGRVFLGDLSPLMFYWLVFRTCAFLTINIIVLFKIKGILTAINDVRTFYETNIDNLRFIGKLAFVTALLSLFNFSYLNDSWDFHFSIPFGPITVSMIAFVLAEVFVEGKLLLEDKNMIV